MEGLEEVRVDGREVENKKVVHFVEDDSPISSKELGNFSELEDPGQSSASSNPLGGTSKRDGDHKRIGQPVDSQKQEPPSAVEDPRAQFWEHYQREVEKEGREFAEKHDEGLRTWLRTVRSRKQESLSADEDRRAQFYKHYQREAKEYDSEFTKKHNEDLNTTLIFAGLFSAVTSAFIIQVHPQLQQDPNDETAALLRVLIYKIDNTTFGNNAPTLPQWPGPPRAIVQVQTILYASFAASLLSALLAMLGKQWLNRYASADVRGTNIERSQNRQRKLNGIVTWYFDHVIESLPLMLQIALLLLGCALSRYLWEINTIIASVILGVTSFGAAFYLSIVVAGAFSVNCPYQTPGARILRYALGILRSVPRFFFYLPHRIPEDPETRYPAARVARSAHSYIWRSSWCMWVLSFVTALPSVVCINSINLGRTIARRLYAGFLSVLSTPADSQTTLELHCISWVLQTSLDKAVQLSALEHLAALGALADFNPTLVMSCFNILISCTKFVGNRLETTLGFEKHATMSAMCLFRTFSYLSVTDSISGVLRDFSWRYRWYFPSRPSFHGPSSDYLTAIHSAYYPDYEPSQYNWKCSEMPAHEIIIFARAATKLARYGYQTHGRAPTWALAFAEHFLSQDPPPPTEVIVNCLLAIAAGLGCDFSGITTMTPDDNARVDQVLNLITARLEGEVEANPSSTHPHAHTTNVLLRHTTHSHTSPTNVLLRYLLRRVQNGEHRMLEVFLCAGGYIKRWIRENDFELHFAMLLSEASPLPLKQAVILASPRVPWDRCKEQKELIQLWTATALAVSHTDEIVLSVTEALFQIAREDSLRPQIPVAMWSWLKKQPRLPPGFLRRSWRVHLDAIRAVGDVEILKLYLLLVWSEREVPHLEDLDEICTTIKEHFTGPGTERQQHRADLLQRLDEVQPSLNLGYRTLRRGNPDLRKTHVATMRNQYRQLKEALLEADRK